MEEVRTCVTKRNSLGLQRMSADWNKETAAVRLFGHPPTKSKVWSLHEVSGGYDAACPHAVSLKVCTWRYVLIRCLYIL